MGHFLERIKSKERGKYMKILMLTPYFYPHTGGTEKYVKDLAIQLVKNGHDVTVVSANVPRSKKAKKEEVIEGVKIKRLPAFDFLYYLPVTWAFNRKMLDGFDVVHIHCPPHSFVRSVAGKTKTPVVATFHCDVTITGQFFGIPIPKLITHGFESIMDAYARLFLPKVEEIISTSVSYGSTSPVIHNMKYNAIPIGVYHDKLDASLKKQGIDPLKDKKKQILFLGRLAANKGVNFLVAAMPKILAKHPDAKLVICGEGEEKPSIVSQIKSLGLENSITFYGTVDLDNLTKLYATSSVFVLPSINRLEAFGIVQLEAMAMYTPVVAADIPGVNSVMDIGKSGLLVPKQNPDAIAEAVNKIIGNPELIKSMGAKGRELVETKYDWPIISKEIEAVYRKAIAKKKGK
jgi:glycosyltransferase involved in cell wall biosynthesis